MVKIEFEEGSEYKWAVNSIIAITKTNSRTKIKISNKTNSKIKNKPRKIITLTIKKTTKTIFKKKYGIAENLQCRVFFVFIFSEFQDLRL